MKAVKAAIDQANSELAQKTKDREEREAHIAKHTGSDADQRVSYIRDLLQKSED